MTIAVEILNSVKAFDASVYNPINFMQLSLLDFGLQKSPNNKTFMAWQVKIYSKLGMTSLVTEISNRISKPDQGTGSGTSVVGSLAAKEFETVGFIRYSHYTEFMADRELELLCR